MGSGFKFCLGTGLIKSSKALKALAPARGSEAGPGERLAGKD